MDLPESRTGTPALPFSHFRLNARKPERSAYPKELITLGDHLRKKRLDLGLLQQEVAQELGINKESVCQWEVGHSHPKPYLIPRVIEFLGYAPYEPPASFGGWLAVARKAKGLSRKRLAKALGVDPSTVDRWEAGKTVPAVEVRPRLRHILGSSGPLPPQPGSKL